MSNAAVEYWDKRFTEGLEHHSRQNAEITRDFVRSITPALRDALTGKHVIEIGCGTGELAMALMREPFRSAVIATDLSPRALSASAERHAVAEITIDENWPRNGGVQFVVHDCSKPIPWRQDTAICSNVLEHFKDPWKILDNMLDAAPKAIVIVPNDQKKLDGYDAEGGAGHVYRFDIDQFRERYNVLDWFTFHTSGWSCADSEYQLAVMVERKPR